MDTFNKKVCMGIDVSKHTLDIYWNTRFYKIPNTPSALTDFLQAQVPPGLDLLCVMESTGGYERLACDTLRIHHCPVHIAHPSRIHSFAKASGHFAKTDKLDALLLYKYAVFISLQEAGDGEKDPLQQEILALRRLARTLEESLQAARCQKNQLPSVCFSHLDKLIALYEPILEEILHQIDAKIDSHPGLKKKREILLSMRGVGPKISAILLAELPELGTVSGKKIASLVGVAPQTYQSGKKKLSGHISGGRFYARQALYMAALVALRWDKRGKDRYQTLKDKGKPSKVALVALMREILLCLNSMLKFEKPYNLLS